MYKMAEADFFTSVRSPEELQLEVRALRAQLALAGTEPEVIDQAVTEQFGEELAALDLDEVGTPPLFA
jgi:hypothetical protein